MARAQACWLGLLLVGGHLPHVVRIGERDVAYPFVDRLGLGTVVALGLAGEVGLHPPEPVLRGRLAVAGDERREECDVVAVLARARAHAAFEPWMGEIGRASDLVRTNPISVSEDHPGASGEPEPEPVRVTQ